MWFLNKEDDSYGYHSDFCNGNYWINGDIKTNCCGSKLCYYCKTPLHGCTDNIMSKTGKFYYKYHNDRKCQKQDTSIPEDRLCEVDKNNWSLGMDYRSDIGWIKRRMTRDGF
jgi:hypothetical protein|tara:strand:+ start:2323 stop:2658 length:336 start_codon:yes stop_codon:yes gene_type:complete